VRSIKTNDHQRLLSLSVSHDVRESKEAARQGGDFFASVQQSDGCLTIAVGDASAKSMKGRYHAHLLKRSFRMAAFQHRKPSEILNTMSREFVNSTRLQPPAEQFASAFIAHIDTHTRRLTYAGAGVEGGMVFRCLTSHEHLIATGPLLGMHDSPDYGERAIAFHPGNVLVAYTDGVTEARSIRDATLLGSRGLAKLVHDTLRLSLAPAYGHLMTRLDTFVGGSYNDDATLVCVTASEANP